MPLSARPPRPARPVRPVRRPLLLLSAAGLGALVACSAGTTAPSATGAPSPAPATGSPSPAPATDDAEQAGAQGTPEFSYAGEDGPQAWGGLSPDYAACADGSAQSPIDLGGATPTSLPDLEFDYRRGALSLKNTVHTVQADETPGSSVTVDGQRYPLVQFHLHEPSEHTIDGRRYDGELHLVHRDADDRIAVVSVLLSKGAPDAALAPFLDALPADAGATTQVPDFDPNALLPTTRRTFRYDGSLTTPPCTEGVRWLVMTTPVEISQGQLDAFRAVIAENDRPLQPRGEREVLLDDDGA